MMMEVLPEVAASSAFMIPLSVMESRLEVASSNTRILEFLRIARAMATLCFSPPDNFSPRSPTWENISLSFTRKIISLCNLSVVPVRPVQDCVMEFRHLSSLFYPVNQSEISIELYQPIRSGYYLSSSAPRSPYLMLWRMVSWKRTQS